MMRLYLSNTLFHIKPGLKEEATPLIPDDLSLKCFHFSCDSAADLNCRLTFPKFEEQIKYFSAKTKLSLPDFCVLEFPLKFSFFLLCLFRFFFKLESVFGG